MKILLCWTALQSERERGNGEIATALEKKGFVVFLPHRDGFEFSNLVEQFKQIGIPDEKATHLLNKAIFTLDVFQVLDSDSLWFKYKWESTRRRSNG